MFWYRELLYLGKVWSPYCTSAPVQRDTGASKAHSCFCSQELVIWWKDRPIDTIRAVSWSREAPGVVKDAPSQGSGPLHTRCLLLKTLIPFPSAFTTHPSGQKLEDYSPPPQESVSYLSLFSIPLPRTAYETLLFQWLSTLATHWNNWGGGNIDAWFTP